MNLNWLRFLYFASIIFLINKCNYFPDSYQYVQFGAGKLFVFSEYIRSGTPEYAEFPVMESTDGVTWTGKTGFSAPSDLGEVVYDSQHSTWIGIASDSVLTSPDAVVWTTSRTNGWRICGLTYDSFWKTVIVSGENLVESGFVVGVITSSDGGVTWQDHNDIFSTTYLPIPPQMCALQSDGLGNTIGLEIPDNSTTAYVNLSVDGGYNWISISSFSCSECLNAANQKPFIYDLATDGQGSWVAVAGSGKIFLSSDNGISWSTPASGQTDDLISAASNGSGSWIITGTNIGGILLSTDNGNSWTLQQVDSNLKTTLDVIYANGMWIVVGFPSFELFKDFNAVYYSTDGINWTAGQKNP